MFEADYIDALEIDADRRGLVDHGKRETADWGNAEGERRRLIKAGVPTLILPPKAQ